MKCSLRDSPRTILKKHKLAFITFVPKLLKQGKQLPFLDFCSLHIHGLYLYKTQGFIANTNLQYEKQRK